MPKAIVLLSGGIDSTTCFHIASDEFGLENVQAISIEYGQRHKKEIDYARNSCRVFGVPHHVLDLSTIIPKTLLTDPVQAVPDTSYDDLPPGMSPTYVPFRNGLMLSAVTSFFVGYLQKNEIDNHDGEHGLYFGAHAEDAQNWAYADCTPEFIGAMANAIHVGAYGTVKLHTPLQWLGKAAIIRKGTELGVDWQRTWSCYKGGDLHCGTCPTCQTRHRGFVKAGVCDLTKYASPVPPPGCVPAEPPVPFVAKQ